MALYGTNYRTEEDYFSNMVFKVNPGKGWQKTVAGILNNVHGVTGFDMSREGEVQVSGMVYPKQLLWALQKSGKNIHVESWKYGQCSRYLQIPNLAKKKILGYNRHRFGHVNPYYDYYENIYNNNGYGGSHRYLNGYEQACECPISNYHSHDSCQCRFSTARAKKASNYSEMPGCCTIM